MKILQNLDQRLFQPRNLQPILDPPNQTDRADLHTDVFEETPDERWKKNKRRGDKKMVGDNPREKTNQVSSQSTSTNPPKDHRRSAPLQNQSRGARPLIAR